MSPQSLSYFTDDSCKVSAAVAGCCSRPHPLFHLQNLCGIIPVADMFVSITTHLWRLVKIAYIPAFYSAPRSPSRVLKAPMFKCRFGCTCSLRRAGNACRGRRRMEQNDRCMYVLHNLPTYLLQPRPFRLRSLNTGFILVLCTESRASCLA